jgi:hypothetical protein
MFNLINQINLYKNKRKNILFLYKLLINKYRKNKTNIKKRISHIRNNKRKRIVLYKNTKEKKIYNYFTKKNILLIRNNTQINLLFYWFLNKIINWLYLLIIQSFIIFFMFKGLLNNKLLVNKKYDKQFIFNWEKKIENKIKLFLYFIRNKKLLKSSVNNLLININRPLINNKNKLVYKNNLNYNRIKSYYRLKKRIIRNKKKKEYELKYSPKIHNLYFRLLNTTKKWFKHYYRMILLTQLKYKIKNTLSNYLYQPVLYIYSYRESVFPRLDSPKLLCDYIKFLMKKEEKIPSIFKKIVEIHSKQRKKSRKRSYFLMRLLSKFKKKILLKLKSSNIKYKKLSNIIYIKKRIKNILRKGINKKNKQIKKYKLKQYVYKTSKKFIINNENKINNKIDFLNNSIHNKYNNINKNNKILNFFNNKLFKKKDRFDLKDILNNWKFKFRDLSYKRYPLIGMRIEFNGPVKKGQRTKMNIYNEWVDFYTLPGKMPLVTVMTDIQYWQSYGLTQRAAVGIKLWMYFFSLNYSQTSKKLLNKE